MAAAEVAAEGCGRPCAACAGWRNWWHANIHPLNNLRVQQYLEDSWRGGDGAAGGMDAALDPDRLPAFEQLLCNDAVAGGFCHGDAPSLADCCLVPQVYNARRFGVDMAAYPAIMAIEQRCLALPAFDVARPERQPDAPSPG